MSKPLMHRNVTGWPSFENRCSEEERALANLEPAWGKVATFVRTGMRFGHPRGSVRCSSLAEIHRLLSVFRTRFEGGDTLSLLQAINVCAEENLPLPEWLALAFRDQMNAFLNPGKHHSLDEVFSSRTVPADSPKKAATARQDWQLGGTLWHAAWELAQDDDTLCSVDAVVERLLASGKYGVGKTKAKALIKMIEVSQSQFLGKDVSLSQFLDKRRKRMTWSG